MKTFVHRRLLAIGILCGFTPLAAFAAPTILNGSFEAVQLVPVGTTPTFSSNPADIPGWTHSGVVGDGALLLRAGPVCCGGTNTALAGDGNQFVLLGGGFTASGSNSWSQTITDLAIGQMYNVTFMMAAEGETATQPLTVGMTSGSSTAAQTFTSPVTNTLFWQNWGTDVYSFLATDASATLQFSVSNQQFDVGLDGVSIAAVGVTPVPEPATFALMGLGLAAGVGLARRKRKV